MQRACDELAAQTDFDLVISSTFMIAPYAAKVGPVPKIIDMMEVSQFVSDTPRALQSWPARQRTALRSAKLVRFLLQLSRSHRYCATASVQDRADLDALVGGWPGETRVIPNCIELGSYANIAPNPGACHALIFSGNLTFGPNLDAMRFFLAEIWPLVRAEQPSSHLKITGHADRAALGPLADDSQVILTGYLPDVRQAVADAMVSVAPLRTGGGTRLKILEAMAIGTPVVATSKGAEGLDVRHEEHLLIADEPRVFAECVVRLLRDADLRRNLAANARALVAARYDWAVVMPRYLDWIDELAANGRKMVTSSK